MEIQTRTKLDFCFTMMQTVNCRYIFCSKILKTNGRVIYIPYTYKYMYIFFMSLETDGPGRPSGNRKMSEMSCDSETSESKETNVLVGKSRASTSDDDKKVTVSPSVSMSLPANVIRLRQRPLSSANNRPTSSMYDSSGSEISRSITPQHKKLLSQLSSPSGGQERPRVSGGEVNVSFL